MQGQDDDAVVVDYALGHIGGAIDNNSRGHRVVLIFSDKSMVTPGFRNELNVYGAELVLVAFLMAFKNDSIV
jgi:hypothetical protein